MARGGVAFSFTQEPFFIPQTFVVLKVGCVGGTSDEFPTCACRSQSDQIITPDSQPGRGDTHINIDTPLLDQPPSILLPLPHIIIPLIERIHIPRENLPFLHLGEIQGVRIADALCAFPLQVVHEDGVRGMLRHDITQSGAIVEFDETVEIVCGDAGDAGLDVRGVDVAESFEVFAVERQVEEGEDIVDAADCHGIRGAASGEAPVVGQLAGGQAEEGESGSGEGDVHDDDSDEKALFNGSGRPAMSRSRRVSLYIPIC